MPVAVDDCLQCINSAATSSTFPTLKHDGWPYRDACGVAQKIKCAPGSEVQSRRPSSSTLAKAAKSKTLPRFQIHNIQGKYTAGRARS
mmetsp:Transcript_131342/g.420229  ORF Transcript_131342/g.420229 Transcript_131342/m.420229 type:complete len:88 (-) Transcript_131342:778-1041(-)